MTAKDRKEDFERTMPADIAAKADALEMLGFFTAPASIKYHGNYEGVLYDHSRQVMNDLINLTDRLELTWVRPESPLIVGMFHDLCKADAYIKTPDGWVHNPDPFLTEHGAKSVILTQMYVTRLTREEIYCIRYHMGPFGRKGADDEEAKEFNRAIKKFENVLFTHTADMIASQIFDT